MIGVTIDFDFEGTKQSIVGTTLSLRQGLGVELLITDCDKVPNWLYMVPFVVAKIRTSCDSYAEANVLVTHVDNENNSAIICFETLRRIV